MNVGGGKSTTSNDPKTFSEGLESEAGSRARRPSSTVGEPGRSSDITGQDLVSAQPLGQILRRDTSPPRLPRSPTPGPSSHATMVTSKRALGSENEGGGNPKRRKSVAESNKELIFHELSVERPIPTFVDPHNDSYRLHGHAYVGKEGFPKEVPVKQWDEVKKKHVGTGAKKPAVPPKWTKRTGTSSLRESTTNLDFSDLEKRNLLRWEWINLKWHVSNHGKEQWFIDMFGEGEGALEEFERQSEYFARLSASTEFVSRFFLLCDH